MIRDSGSRRWRVRDRRCDHEWVGPLVARWEAHLDPMSDDYTPTEIDAFELFRRWSGQVRQLHPDEMIPIFWFVECPGEGKFELMPFQYIHTVMSDTPLEDFLTFYSWPVDSETGKPVNWLTLPVVDKRWNGNSADKGGFIQEATGWKPAILQPFVYLPSLLAVLR